MRIGMFLNSGVPPEKSPISTQTLLLSKELEKRGHDVETFSYGKSLRLNNYQTQGLEPKLIKILHPRMLRRYIRDFDIFHLHHFNWAPTNYIPLIKPFLGKYLVGTGYGSDIRSLPMILKKRIRLKYILKVLDHLIVTDPDLKAISEKFSMKSKKISILPSALKVEKFLPERPIPKDIENLVQNRIVVLFNARLHPFKDPLTVIKAIPYVLKYHKDIIFLISGDGELKSTIKRLCQKLKIEDSVFLLGWRQDIPNLLSAADIFLQTSPFENIWALSLMEAMLMGKAIIATNVGFTTKYLKDRKEVLLINPKNPKKLAEAILELSENAKLKEKMGKNCQNYALQEFAFEKRVDKIEEIYLNL